MKVDGVREDNTEVRVRRESLWPEGKRRRTVHSALA